MTGEGVQSKVNRIHFHHTFRVEGSVFTLQKLSKGDTGLPQCCVTATSNLMQKAI